MTPGEQASAPVIVIGGGLAGIAAAAALAERGLPIELFEARQRLGGRAASFRDPESGELVDLCQHVGMGCCTNLHDFCQRMGLAEFFRRDRTLNFVGPDGRFCKLGAGWLPAPFHLAPALMRLGYLSLRERLGIARAMWRLMRPGREIKLTAGAWLRKQRQSPRAIEWFWTPVLVSALGESLDEVDFESARQVFVEGFLANRHGYEIDVPTVPLGEIYGARLVAWLAANQVQVQLGAGVRQVDVAGGAAAAVVLADGTRRECSAAIIAVPWHKARGLISERTLAELPQLDGVQGLEGSPITGVHLWFDRPFPPLPHAVLVGRLSQWIFFHTKTPKSVYSSDRQFYCQVVVSASKELAGQNREAIVDRVCDELRQIWPELTESRLLRSRVVTENAAVFSVRPGSNSIRPPQRTNIRGLYLAGDWTRTGWPATMEGAVRSGRMAAQELLRDLGRDESVLAPDLPRGPLALIVLGRQGIAAVASGQ